MNATTVEEKAKRERDRGGNSETGTGEGGDEKDRL